MLYKQYLFNLNHEIGMIALSFTITQAIKKMANINQQTVCGHAITNGSYGPHYH